jgi:hypothetical protein
VSTPRSRVKIAVIRVSKSLARPYDFLGAFVRKHVPIEYKLLSSEEGLAVFSKKITELLNQGWELQGSVVASAQSGPYAQALTRETTGAVGGGKKKNATRKNARSRK